MLHLPTGWSSYSLLHILLAYLARNQNPASSYIGQSNKFWDAIPEFILEVLQNFLIDFYPHNPIMTYMEFAKQV